MNIKHCGLPIPSKFYKDYESVRNELPYVEIVFNSMVDVERNIDLTLGYSERLFYTINDDKEFHMLNGGVSNIIKLSLTNSTTSIKLYHFRTNNNKTAIRLSVEDGKIDNEINISVTGNDFNTFIDNTLIIYGNNSDDGAVHERINIIGIDVPFGELKTFYINDINLSSINTTHFKSFNNFITSSNLKTINLDLPNFNTLTNIKDCSYFISRNKNLETLVVPASIMNNAENLYAAFYDNDKLVNINTNQWNLNKAKDISYLFNSCESITNINASSWNLTNVLFANNSFEGLSNLSTLNMSGVSLQNVKETNAMFKNCLLLQNLDVSSFDMSNVEKIDEMFSGMTMLTSVDIGSWNIKNLVSSQRTFFNCKLIEVFDVYNWDVSNLLNCMSMFAGCNKALTINTSKWVNNVIKNASFMYSNCNIIETIDISGIDLSNCTTLEGFTYNCYKLKNMNIQNNTTNNVTTFNRTFYNCSLIDPQIVMSLKLTNKVTSVARMLYNTPTTILTSNWDLSGAFDVDLIRSS